jgi:TatA/E family protein of Tat protein translocase
VFGSIGGPELIIIFVVALLIFGPRKLPDLGRAIGRGMAEFRKAASDLRQTLDTEVARNESGRSGAPQETVEKESGRSGAPQKTVEKESGAPDAADAGKRNESD